ncbi:MAG: VOC family protein [Sediminibacterium sp.]
MLTEISPKMPMRDKSVTKNFYTNKLGFREIGNFETDDYLMLQKDSIQIHFFKFKELDPTLNYGQVYIRTDDIDNFFQTLIGNKTEIHPNGYLTNKPWGQREFSLLDPDSNLLTFGQTID